MRRSMIRLGTLAAAAIALAGAGNGYAGLLPVSNTVTQDGDNYRYSYGVVLTTDSVLHTGDYFTIYDFQGYIDGSNVQPDGFSFSTATTGPTPAGTVPTDDPTMSNVTWTYTGAETTVGQAGLGNFMVQSTYGATTQGVFTALTHRQVDDKVDSNITEADVPVPAGPGVPGVPEPTSLALLGVGLPLAGLFRYLRRR